MRCGASRLGSENNFFLVANGFPQTCHPEERRISAKIGDYDCRVSCGDPSFLRMTKMAKKLALSKNSIFSELNKKKSQSI